MYFSTLTLLFASTALITAAPTLPRPRPLPRQAPPQSADDIPAEPPFQVLTCQAQSIVVRSEWNTAFIVSQRGRLWAGARYHSLVRAHQLGSTATTRHLCATALSTCLPPQTSDETYSHYGDRTLTVPLNGCRDLQATVNAYDVNAAKEPTPINSLDVSAVYYSKSERDVVEHDTQQADITVRPSRCSVGR